MKDNLTMFIVVITNFNCGHDYRNKTMMDETPGGYHVSSNLSQTQTIPVHHATVQIT